VNVFITIFNFLTQQVSGFLIHRIIPQSAFLTPACGTYLVRRGGWRHLLYKCTYLEFRARKKNITW